MGKGIGYLKKKTSIQSLFTLYKDIFKYTGFIFEICSVLKHMMMLKNRPFFNTVDLTDSICLSYRN